MAILNINNLKKEYGIETVLKDFSLNVNQGESVALIGPNGSGKTTIFRIITGQEHFSEGTVSVRNDIEVGYLDQLPDFNTDLTIYQELEKVFEDVFSIPVEALNQTNGKVLKEIYPEMTETIEKIETLRSQKIKADTEDRKNDIPETLKEKAFEYIDKVIDDIKDGTSNIPNAMARKLFKKVHKNIGKILDGLDSQSEKEEEVSEYQDFFENLHEGHLTDADLHKVEGVIE